MAYAGAEKYLGKCGDLRRGEIVLRIALVVASRKAAKLNKPFKRPLWSAGCSPGKTLFLETRRIFQDTADLREIGRSDAMLASHQ